MPLDAPITCDYLLERAVAFARDELTEHCNTNFFLVNCSPAALQYIRSNPSVVEELDTPFISLQEAALSVQTISRV